MSDYLITRSDILLRIERAADELSTFAHNLRVERADTDPDLPLTDAESNLLQELASVASGTAVMLIGRSLNP